MQPFHAGEFLAKLTRPQNILYPGLLSALTSYMANRRILISLLCFVCFWCLYAIAVSYNNLQDIHTDKLNKRTDNPLTVTQVPSWIMWQFLAVNLTVFVCAQIFFTQPVSIIIASVYIALAILYSHPKASLQSRGWIAHILLAACYGSLPLFFGMLQSARPSLEIMIVGAFQIPLLLPVLLAKDYKDIVGDKLTGKLTPLVRYGKRTVTITSITLAVVTASICTYIFLVTTVNFYFWGILLCIWYVTFCIFLHKHEGKLPNLIKKTGILCILAISLLVNYSLLIVRA